MSYSQVDIPATKDPKAYTYVERRAEIFQMIIEAGHPDMISRTELGNYYDVAPSTITRDIEKIKQELQSQVSDDAQLITETFYRKAVREKIADGEYMDANKLIKDWNEWLFDVGKQEKVDPDAEETTDLAEQWAQNLHAEADLEDDTDEDESVEEPTLSE